LAWLLLVFAGVLELSGWKVHVVVHSTPKYFGSFAD
jgi:aromatic ring-opening dioxygenase LigB subunit